MDSTREYGHYNDASLGEFLSRPVQITEGAWSTTVGPFSYEFNPWVLFLTNPQVAAKISGYRMLQGKLHVRVAINGGPMFYGKAIMAYEPRHVQNDHARFVGFDVDSTIMQMSMLPHIYLDATTSTGGQMDLPFFCPDNWIDLLGNTADEMGTMYLRSINSLQHANTASANVTMKVYAWMSEVKLCGPTTRGRGTYIAQAGTEIAVGAAGLSLVGAVLAWLNRFKCSYVGDQRHSSHDESSGMTAQAGDEYGTGVVSKPASIVARLAGALSGIPKIAPYAMATQMAASMLGKLAHHLGFSRPNIVSTLARCKIVNTGLLANSDQHDAATKLAFDSKTEVTIDPRVVGLSDIDEMTFDYIKTKECYLMQASWSETDPENSLIASLSVGPDQHQFATTTGGYTANLFSPLYTLAAPFTYWRGSIIFRFQIVASQLHRGRIRITYDPYIHSTPYDENEVYTRIIDIAENRDFEIPVAWNQARAWLRVLNRAGFQGSTFIAAHTDGSRTQTVGNANHNGQLRIEVLNNLTSPNPALAQPVYLNVFVRGGPDFEVAGPTSAMLETLEYVPNTDYVAQSGIEMVAQAGEEEVIDEADDIPESPPSITPVGASDSLTDPLYHVFMGEKISSVRSLIKRYTFHKSLPIASDFGIAYDYNFPTMKGQFEVRNSTTAATADPSSQSYHYAAMTFLNWFKPCYIGWRGGVRAKYMSFNTAGTARSSFVYVKRLAQPLAQTNISDVIPLSFDAPSLVSFDVDVMGGVAGSEIAATDTEGALEVEFPYISYRRFHHCRAEQKGTGNNDEPFTGEHHGHMLYVSGAQNMLQKFVAAGDDFSFHFFCGQPPMIRRFTPNNDGRAFGNMPQTA
jgi:hypothetical protein